jgi:hypothetical protein
MSTATEVGPLPAAAPGSPAATEGLENPSN